MDRTHERTQTVVVGAGVGGLNAARLLHAGGRDVVVLESRERIGGRLALHRSDDGAVFDLGATWFWAGERRVTDLIRSTGIEIHDQYIAGDAMYQDLERSQRVDGNPIDVPARRFVNGATAVTDALAAALPEDGIRLGCAAHAVIADRDGVTIEHERGSIAAEHVVIAIPPALAVHRLTFEPPLADRLAGLAAATPVWMGGITKVVVRYATAFWRTAGLAGAAISHRGPMREIHDMSGPGGTPAALFGFVPQQQGEATPEFDAVLAQLIALFGDDAADPIEVAIHDWRAEPDTSPPGVERLTAYQTFGDARFAEPALGGRMHWASTETATESPGHIEGALAAGERAAAAILRTDPTHHESVAS